MAARHGFLARVLGSLAISASLALLVVQPLAVHAAGPTISASVTSFTTIHVSGYGFGSGDRVKVTDSLGQRVFTTATRTIILPPPPPPKCQSSNPCLYDLAIPGGRITVTMPPHDVKCVLERVAVRALDLTNGTRSNVVNVIIGEGPC